jgi:hypothetical protein
MRTIIDLTDEQVARLARLCERKGISRAEAVRRGVELVLDCEEAEEEEFERALQAAFGSWKGYGIDGLEYQRAIRAEWDRDDR